jgi:hypothetical protein
MYAASNASANTNQVVFDDHSVRQVNTPSATGVTITTTADGSTYNWTSIDSGFNPNDAIGYIYTISSTVMQNVWQSTVATQPYVVWFNGTLGTLETAVANLTAANKWYWSGNVLYVYSTSDPTTAYTSPGIEASARSNMYANGLSYLTFDGITFTRGGNDSSGSVAFKLRNCQNIVVQNCSVTKSTGIGIDIFTVGGTTGDVLIDHCSFSDTGQSKVSTDANSAIQTYNTGDTPTFTVQYCTFRDIDIYGAHHGHGIYHTSGKLIWRYNFHYGDNGGFLNSGAAVRLASTGGAQVYSNIFTNIGGHRYWGFCNGNEGPYLIYNNIFFNNHYPYFGNGTSTTLKNNIFFNTDSTLVDYITLNDVDSTGFTADNNLFYSADNPDSWIWSGVDKESFADWKTAAGQDTHSLNTNPLFVSTVTPDFSLLLNSPCINAGTSVGLTQDYAGNPVPRCSLVDIGAYEDQINACPVATTGGGLPGGYSDPPAPGLNGFRIIINNNDAKTNSRDVSLTFEAGYNVKYVIVSGKADLSGAGFEHFEPGPYCKTFTLSQGDGLKKAYAKFCTEYSRCSDIVSDEIVLDTTASEQGSQEQTTQQQEQQQTTQQEQTLTSNLLRAISDTRVYQIINNLKHWIPNPQTFNSYGFDWQKIQEVTESKLDDYARAKLLRSEGDIKVYYLTEAGLIRHLPSPEVFNSYNNKWEDIIEVSQAELSTYPINNLIRLEYGIKVYKLENYTKRWVETAEVFNRLKYNWTKIAPVNQTELDYYPEAEVIK